MKLKKLNVNAIKVVLVETGGCNDGQRVEGWRGTIPVSLQTTGNGV